MLSFDIRLQVRKLLDDGVNVGLGVDRSASNDCGNLLSEARLACFLQRAYGDVKGMIPTPCYLLISEQDSYPVHMEPLR